MEVIAVTLLHLDATRFSLGVDLGAARTGLAVGRGITQPRPLTVRALKLKIYHCALLRSGDLGFEDGLVDSLRF